MMCACFRKKETKTQEDNAVFIAFTLYLFQFFFHGRIFLGGFRQVFGEDFDLKCRLLFVNRKHFLHRCGFFVGATSGILTVESVKIIESIQIQRVAESILEKVLEKLFGLKVFEFEGAPPFKVFKLEVLKVLEFEGAMPFKRT
jgi:hypothetical protein